MTSDRQSLKTKRRAESPPFSLLAHALLLLRAYPADTLDSQRRAATFLGDLAVLPLNLRLGRLVVKAAHCEPDAPPETACELAAELVQLATWLDLGAVEVEPAGDLAGALAAAVAAI